MKDGKPDEDLQARELLNKIADATWRCGDPGMQFDTTINRWHTSKNTARINASQSLLRVHVPRRLGLQPGVAQPDEVRVPNGTFDVESLSLRRRRASSPRRKSWSTSPVIRPNRSARNSHDYRPLGLGYANLGALLMATGLPYDSDAGRDYAACVTAIMCGEAYKQSCVIAEQCPPLAPPAEFLKANAAPSPEALARASTTIASRSSTSSACTARR